MTEQLTALGLRTITRSAFLVASKVHRTGEDLMRRTVVLLAVVGLTLSSAGPVTAEPPDVTVSVFPQEWEVDNPCTDEEDPLVLAGTTTLREIIRDEVRRITAVSHQIDSPALWSGQGTDTGVELTQGEVVFFQITVTNSETSQKFRFFARGHFNSNTGEWNTGDFPLFGQHCIRP